MFTRDIAHKIITVGDIVYSIYSDAKYKVEEINPKNGRLHAACVIDDNGTLEIQVNDKGKEYNQWVYVCPRHVSRSKKLANFIIRLRNIWYAIKRMGKYAEHDLNNYDLHDYLDYHCGIEDMDKRYDAIDAVIAQVCHESTKFHE